MKFKLAKSFFDFHIRQYCTIRYCEEHNILDKFYENKKNPLYDDDLWCDIGDAFSWHDSPERFDFWNKHYINYVPMLNSLTSKYEKYK